MKKVAACLLFFMSLSSFIFTQEIKNSEKPLNKYAGRVIKLKKVMTISDLGDVYYFNSPSVIKISPDKTIFILDTQQLLQFDPQGNFIRNFFKKGEGPGEVEEVSSFSFFQGQLILHDRRLNKILWFDLSGKLKKEFRIYKKTGILEFLFFSNNRYYFIKSGIPNIKGNPRIVDDPQHLVFYNNKDSSFIKIATFPTKSFVAVFNGARGSLETNRLIVASYKEKLLFISHSPEYSIKVYDIEKKEIIREFKRVYRRIKTPREIQKAKNAFYVILMGKKFTHPLQKYLNDIRNLVINEDRLWVFTSTTDKKKGVLVDVFDLQGKYLDNFYLQFPKKITYDLYNFMDKFNTVALDGKYLFIFEMNPDSTYKMVKYEIEDDWRQTSIIH